MERTTLYLFWTAMLICAGLVITGMWLDPKPPEAFFKTAATCFVIGLASFLLWAPRVTYRFLQSR